MGAVATSLVARRIDHVGVVVRDIDAAMGHFAARFGLRLSTDWVDPDGRFRLAYLEAGDTTLQLVTPLKEGPLNAFLAERGEAIHHICFAVDDLEAALAAVPGGAEATPYLGGRGARVCFLVERSYGVLVELTEPLMGVKDGAGSTQVDGGHHAPTVDPSADHEESPHHA